MVRPKIGEIERGHSDKVEKILQGAMREFLKQGYAGTSMDRVAEAAGVSKATVYSHFQDKVGLFSALIERLARKQFQSIFGQHPLVGEPFVVLRSLAKTALEQMMTDPEYLAFERVLIGESVRFPELAQVFIRSIAKPAIETISQYLGSHPELKIPDPEATARILIGSIAHFAITQKVLYGEDIIPMESDRLIDALTHLIVTSAEATNNNGKVSS
ncbi:TetR/AcrR family transcriptional regulator [Anabaena cylindrica FACHB-243]|uniref:Transcriptional regulator, TetR family n=1 Tax=Anabaena cylindrica (strain ATCC 27899 / PCC 7122) TaxID=272123 RepID=K9ZKN0_ANACC|nr:MULTISPECIES: TetR/AcrR family transcriptional regulator [Anabaena]AFZ58890.1 transcriptional regulator, TetR family [Anabaena cylindrica PCC 7122]MBD2419474.1 TetR/AcrR family transcriptional regulator [Anabaena cylindrica FACHB-243]MBY5283779.1 TetR/AcrR family transcriptional regulator [Anabaena sp. CCAP 1446/1C]MBY5306185.1 TetR/AcrR family transcriptional regulator [Anabaena sp. CCAP 1446/1C]MCM2408343.1 TetR/AcrR family transcriptional regulator [Anabaena sp. CCAP 1446/1C]